MSDTTSPSRRSLLAGAAAAATSALASSPGAAQKVEKAVARPAARAGGPAPGAGRMFFTDREYAILDEVAEMIIPADEVSDGARATRIATYLDARIGENRDPATRQSWRDDLAEIDRLSQEMFGRPFVKASFEQRTRLMQRIAKNEAEPKEPGEYAFGTIKWAVADAYYRTRTGIHDDLKYQGNVLQAEFSGTDVGGK